ncbi:MAG TPA: hypothetical protein VFQ70_04430 [Candidatus Saccharimonadaceae bacterium]|nr:hypothetical protein [Candidatus Saccharimonadaceae bacterium]
MPTGVDDLGHVPAGMWPEPPKERGQYDTSDTINWGATPGESAPDTNVVTTASD